MPVDLPVGMSGTVSLPLSPGDAAAMSVRHGPIPAVRTRPTITCQLSERLTPFDMASFEDAVAMTADWPGVSQENWYGTPGLKVGGKGFCRLWGEREHKRDDVHDTAVLVVMCDVDEKDALISSAPTVLFTTPHYEGHGGMLIRLDDIDPDDLVGYLEDSYRLKASPTLLAQFDAT